MAKRTLLIGKAALTVVRLSNGTRANVAAGRVVPGGILPSDRDRLLDEGFIERIELLDDDGVDVLDIDPDELEPEGPNPPGEPDADAVVYTDDELDERLDDGSIDHVLDQTGDDAVLASALLAREQSREKPRPKLVKGLEEVVAADAEQDVDPNATGGTS
jgi:hypothetical protein